MSQRNRFQYADLFPVALQNIAAGLRDSGAHHIYDAGSRDGDDVAPVDLNIERRIARFQQILQANGDRLRILRRFARPRNPRQSSPLAVQWRG